MDDDSKIEKLRLLTIYAIVSAVIIIVLIIVSLHPFYYSNGFNRANSNARRDSLHISNLTAKRVDIIELDRQLAISLSNSKTSAKLRFDGQILHGAWKGNLW